MLRVRLRGHCPLEHEFIYGLRSRPNINVTGGMTKAYRLRVGLVLVVDGVIKKVGLARGKLLQFLRKSGEYLLPVPNHGVMSTLDDIGFRVFVDGHDGLAS